MMKHVVTSLTTGRVHVGTRLAVSLHRRNVAEGKAGMTETCTTSSAARMHAAGSKTSVWSTSDVKRGSMTTTVPIMTNLTDNILLREGVMQEDTRHFPMT
jgi:hypothetical protein